ncbi:MAG: hypothetical protein EZS28_056010 [Streblomastix strix]|uniref:Uncharacterized protein n=1 Tax=Streblomastix strix TaxID=222440 RepID=A0A5J4PS39_9EUKA|nr:MAG: hypothetical protein EZS28_056010 [Streblomastix strix]
MTTAISQIVVKKKVQGTAEYVQEFHDEKDEEQEGFVKAKTKDGKVVSQQQDKDNDNDKDKGKQQKNGINNTEVDKNKYNPQDSENNNKAEVLKNESPPEAQQGTKLDTTQLTEIN